MSDITYRKHTITCLPYLNLARIVKDNLPPTLSGGKASWLVLYDAPGADRKEGEHIVFGDLLRHD